MAQWLYNLALGTYFLGVRLSAPFHQKARQLRDGQRVSLGKMAKYFAGNTQPVAWFHCASLGEFEQARPLIEAYRQRFPGHQVLLTLYSPSGYEVCKDYPKADCVAYLPEDTAANARQLCDIVRPRIAFFIKYEFWFHHLSELINRHIPVIGVACIFRPDHPYFNKGYLFMRNVLRQYNAIFVQNEESYDLLSRYHFTNAVKSRDTRFDRVYDVCQAHRTLPQIANFKAEKRLLVIGSCWPSDLRVIAPVLNTQFPDLRLIIAPHDISENQIRHIEKSLNHRQTLRYSAVLDDEQEFAQADTLIIDNIGMLTSLYQYADLAYVGGAFKEGLHSILEPAVFGNPVIFGREYRKYHEAGELIRHGGGFSIASTEEFAVLLTLLLNDTSRRRKSGNASYQFIREHLGATQQIINYVEEIYR